jgi:cell division protease FtsH
MANKGFNDNMENNSPDMDNNRRRRRLSLSWIYFIVAAILIGVWLFNTGPQPYEQIYDRDFNDLVANKEIDYIEYVERDKKIDVYIKQDVLADKPEYEKFRETNSKGPHFYWKIADFSVVNENLNQLRSRLVEAELAKDTTLVPTEVEEEYSFTTKVDNSRSWGGELLWLVFPLLLIVMFIMSMRAMPGAGGGGVFNIGKSKAQLFDSKNPQGISFKDVAGMESAKYEVEEIVDFLKNPKKYTELGGKIPKGALLVGPPGTGKTLLAKAVAGEAQVPFFSLSGSDFVEMFVGVGASRVRDLFKTAKSKAPCIIFIDEIDAIGRARGRNSISGANDERESTLNQLLTEMDGFSTNTGVIILAATNRADVLDRALLRAGRFDRQIYIDLPNLNERKGIFEVHVRNLKLGKDVDLDFFAKQTPGFSGADIANVCNEAALIAARNAKKSIDKEDFLAAVDRIVGGLEKRSHIISPEEKKVIAFHEAGHASASWLLEHASPLVKVTIVPRGKSLGAAWYLPEERSITTFEQLYDEMTATLAGRAAEEVVFGKISTGALSDLEKVTKQAYSMVVYYGLNKNIGNISYYDSTGQQEYQFSKPFSEKTAENIDKEIHDLIEGAYERAKNILSENKDKLTQLANILLEKELIFAENLEEIFGKRDFGHAEEQPAVEEKETPAAEESPEASQSSDSQ